MAKKYLEEDQGNDERRKDLRNDVKNSEEQMGVEREPMLRKEMKGLCICWCTPIFNVHVAVLISISLIL